MVLGSPIGLVAAYSRGKLDDLLMRDDGRAARAAADRLALVLAATVGPKLWLIVLAVGLTTMPRAARVTRGAAVEVVERDFVGAAEAIGDSARAHPVQRGAAERRQPADGGGDACG